jgi:hypothetical protein
VQQQRSELPKGERLRVVHAMEHLELICLLPRERVARCIRAQFGRRSMISLATGSFEMWRGTEEIGGANTF